MPGRAGEGVRELFAMRTSLSCGFRSILKVEEVFDQVAVGAILHLSRLMRQFSLRGLRISPLDALRLAFLRFFVDRALSQFLHPRVHQRYKCKSVFFRCVPASL